MDHDDEKCLSFQDSLSKRETNRHYNKWPNFSLSTIITKKCNCSKLNL